MSGRLAVILPSHDDGEDVRAALDSIREDEPVEVVVVDDGSTDPRSLAALSEIEASGVRVLRQPNAGPARARTTGLRATSAPFVLALDADDLLEPGACGALADLLDEHPKAGVAWGDYEEFGDRSGRYRTPDRLLPWTTTYVNLYHPSCMFRRELLEALGGWPDMGYEDWGLMIAMIERGVTGVRLERVTYRRQMRGHGRRLKTLRSRHLANWRELRRRYPDAFARRREWAALERPALWKRVVYPAVYGPRLLVPGRLENAIKSSRVWAALRPLRR